MSVPYRLSANAPRDDYPPLTIHHSLHSQEANMTEYTAKTGSSREKRQLVQRVPVAACDKKKLDEEKENDSKQPGSTPNVAIAPDTSNDLGLPMTGLERQGNTVNQGLITGPGAFQVSGSGSQPSPMRTEQEDDSSVILLEAELVVQSFWRRTDAESDIDSAACDSSATRQTTSSQPDLVEAEPMDLEAQHIPGKLEREGKIRRYFQWQIILPAFIFLAVGIGSGVLLGLKHNSFTTSVEQNSSGPVNFFTPTETVDPTEEKEDNDDPTEEKEENDD
jgi:hypothetical protein